MLPKQTARILKHTRVRRWLPPNSAVGLCDQQNIQSPRFVRFAFQGAHFRPTGQGSAVPLPIRELSVGGCVCRGLEDVGQSVRTALQGEMSQHLTPG